MFYYTFSYLLLPFYNFLSINGLKQSLILTFYVPNYKYYLEKNLSLNIFYFKLLLDVSLINTTILIWNIKSQY